ncbi:MAG: hypothetical protein KDB24_12555, partial [Microthrixaceae bacterium]|nr:hypothetical protein [Microthrixaceae bacterium]
MTSPPPTEAPPDEPEADPLTGADLGRRRIGMILASIALLAIIAMWVAAFAGWGSTDSIDRLADERWVDSARDICTDRRAEFDELPGASSAETPQDRADIVSDSIAIFTRMTDQLRALDPPADQEEARLVTEWLGDWGRHLDDRQRFVDQLEEGREDAVFTESLRDEK